MDGIRRYFYGIYGNGKTDAVPTEGSERYAVQQEISMTSRYAGVYHHQERGEGRAAYHHAGCDRGFCFRALGVPGSDKGKPQKVQKMGAKKRHAVFVRCRFCNQNCFKMS